jgi:hypothetical protein
MDQGDRPACHNQITADLVTRFRTQLTWLRNFIDTVYVPDVQVGVATLFRRLKEYGEDGLG